MQNPFQPRICRTMICTQELVVMTQELQQVMGSILHQYYFRWSLIQEHLGTQSVRQPTYLFPCTSCSRKFSFLRPQIPWYLFCSQCFDHISVNNLRISQFFSYVSTDSAKSCECDKHVPSLAISEPQALQHNRTTSTTTAKQQQPHSSPLTP